MGLLRYGTTNDFWPQGWQLDVEAAAFPRLDGDRNLIESDFRAGLPLTTRQGPWEVKVGYLHNCSHIGDLYLLAHPDFQRINYVRDAIIWGVALYRRPGFRLYTETNWAFHTDGGAELWEFQFGADFISPTADWPLRGAVLCHQRALARGKRFRRQHDRADWLALARPHRAPAPNRRAVLHRHERAG